MELDAEHAQRVPGAEQGGVPPPQVKLKERQKFFEEAFQQDMEQYLSTGYLQIAERRGEKEERWGQTFFTGATAVLFDRILNSLKFSISCGLRPCKGKCWGVEVSVVVSVTHSRVNVEPSSIQMN